ncbi:hypothetical protein IWW34DRAFT_148540 [Fusarium oxysporum f. sp. albedinis]|nr:hypothetical protein IWW34DRAFT_148540 [Fusarium oxysporum f. sp. albedinis]
MEYTGKPSTACLPCRQKRRKISLMRSSFPCSSFSDWSIASVYALLPGLTTDVNQCDYAKPGCSQCARQNIHCPGYESDWDLRFRDETTFLAQGTSKRKANQAVKRSTPSPPNSQGSPASKSSPTRAISIPTVDSVVSYFMFSYIDSTVYGRYLPQLYAPSNSAATCSKRLDHNNTSCITGCSSQTPPEPGDYRNGT